LNVTPCAPIARRPVRAEALQSIEELLRGFSPLCARARGYLVVQDASRLFTGYVGPLGKVSHAPAAVVFAGDFHLPRYMEAVGYFGEGIILEATSLGLGTCWMTGSFSRERIVARVNLAPGVEGNCSDTIGLRGEKQDAGGYGVKGLVQVRFPEAFL
jgi:hypothetical protein